MREAVTGDGSIADTTWTTARHAGWSLEQLAEAFAYVGLVSYCDRFARYAASEFEVHPATPPRGG